MGREIRPSSDAAQSAGLAAQTAAATTTHFYNALFSYFYVLIGLGAWLMAPQPHTARRTRWVVLSPQQPLSSS
jgi:hypothetical protein